MLGRKLQSFNFNSKGNQLCRGTFHFLQKAALQISFELETAPMSQRVIRESTGLKEATGLTVGSVMSQACTCSVFRVFAFFILCFGDFLRPVGSR